MVRSGKLAIGVFCSDWRLHQADVHIDHALKEHLAVDGVDVIALPGPDSLSMAEKHDAERAILTRWLRLLIEAHRPVAIAFVAHYDCAGHPVEDRAHDRDIEKTMQAFQSALGFDGEMIALCAVRVSDTEWPLKEIARISGRLGD